MKKSLTLTLISLVLALCVLLPGWAALAEDEAVYYFNASDVSYKPVTSYKTIKNSGSSWYDLTSGWYVVDGNVTLSSKTTLRITGDVHLILCDRSTLTVGDGVYIKDGSSLSIYGQLGNSGKLVAKPESGPGIGGMNNTRAGNLYIHGGTIEAKGGTNAAGIGGGNHDSGYGDIIIYGGRVTATGGSSGAGIGKGQQNSPSKCGSIQIYGGTVTAIGGDYAAGIGGGEDRDGGSITIYDGRVTATGGKDGAGIGGGESGSGGTIAIHGGTVEASSKGQGAGIGGGEDGHSGDITIDGGWITATGGKNGAGIGGGERGNGKTITLRNSWINATGNANGAGIGGGSDGNGGDITIENATVTAESADGAGIGGGKGAGAGTVTIKSGRVNAESEGGAGIGGGNDSGRGTININGGTVIAKSRGDGAAIGGGYDADFIGTISITEGSVTAKGGDGAGIGAGNAANFKGTVNISGGSIHAEGDWAAAIGAGCEGSLGDGGECSGNINITGGWVTAVSGGDRVYPISMAIGCGHNGSESGNLSLYLNAEVKGGYDAKRSRPYGWSERVNGCHQAYAVITPGHAYIIGFKANGGTGDMAKGEPDADGKYIVPENGFTAPEGQVFAGWKFGEEEVKPGDEITVTTESDLVAQWQPLSIAITFDANGGSGEMEAAQPDGNGSYTLPECGFTAPEGMEFAGWLADAQTAEAEAEAKAANILNAGDAIDVSADTTLIAQWRTPERADAPEDGNISVTVTLQVVNGAWEDGTREARIITLSGSEGAELRLNANDIPNLTAPDEGYMPGGWDVEPPIYSAEDDRATGEPITEDVTYTYTYAPISAEATDAEQAAEGAETTPAANSAVSMFNVLFFENGGEGQMEGVEVEDQGTYTLPECGFTAPEGMEFAGWEIGEETYPAGESIVITGDTLLVATWKSIGTGEQPAEEPVVESAEQPVEEPVVESVEQPVEEPAEQPAEQPTVESVEQPAEEPTVESVEQPVEEPIVESAEPPMEESVEQPVVDPAKLPVEESSELPVEEFAELPVEQPAEIPAAGRTCTITFDGGGADGEMLPVQATEGSAYAIPECAYVLDGLPFDMWEVQRANGGEPFGCRPGDSITVDDDMTLTACWLLDETPEVQAGAPEGDIEYGGETETPQGTQGDDFEIEYDAVPEEVSTGEVIVPEGENPDGASEPDAAEVDTPNGAPSEVGSVFSGAGIAAIIAALILVLAAVGIAAARRKKQ